MLYQTWKFISAHPLTRDHRLSALGRFARYQLITRTRKSAVVPWFGGTSFVVERGMTGASGNVYCGLHEVADMAFFMHLLRKDDLFVDIGANIGSYTLLASKVCGSDSIAFEPDPRTFSRLKANIEVNRLSSIVQAHCMALLDRSGRVNFSEGEDTTNHVMEGDGGQSVRCEKLDDVIKHRSPTAIKIDVEGAEIAVLRGAKEILRAPSLLAVEAEGWAPEVAALLKEADLLPAYYDPFRRELTAAPGAINGGNALFVRDLSRVQEILKRAPYRAVLTNVRI